MVYDSYFVEGLENKICSQIFIKLLLACSDSFSLIYFRNSETEKYKRTTLKIKQALAPYLLSSEIVTAWPGTSMMGEHTNQVYLMECYKVIKNNQIFDQISVLNRVDTLWDWNYPRFPMDPCFYKDGRVWFQSTIHEHMNKLFLEQHSFPSVEDIESIGLKLIPCNQHQ